MSATISRLSGDEWQIWANKILSVHYGPTEYQQVPDHDRGDAGIEGFTRTDGHAFQAYGCEEPISTSERYDRQRDKITEDIGKFMTNQKILTRIFGNIRITRWALFVPHCDSKELVAHAAKKTAEVKKANLPYVADTFQVCVCQQADFSIADSKLICFADRHVRIQTDGPTDADIVDWREANQAPSAVLTSKLFRMPTLRTEQDRTEFHSRVLNWYLKGQDILDSLRSYPEIYAKVKEAKAHRESYLVTGLISGLAPQDHLMQAVNDLRSTLALEVRELHNFSSESLAFEAIADWLLRCPLDFPDIANG